MEGLTEAQRTIDREVGRVLVRIGIDHDTTYVNPQLGRPETASEVAFKLHTLGRLSTSGFDQLKAAGLLDYYYSTDEEA